MALLKHSFQFCVFCYRSDNHSISVLAKSSKFYLFLKLIERFNGESYANLEKQMQLNQLGALSLSHVVGCCEGCRVIINEFCDIYHQLKCLEMQQEWKIDKLLSIIKLANKVPSRVSQVNIALQLQQTGIIDNTDNEKFKVINKFRKCFVKQCRRRLIRCQPRILLSRKYATLRKPTQPNHQFFGEISHEDITTQLDNELTTESKQLTGEAVDPVVNSNLIEINFTSSVSGYPNPIIKPNEDYSCPEGDINEQSDKFEDTFDDNDSISSHDGEEDPLHMDNDTQEENNICSVPNHKNFTEHLLQAKLEFPDVPTQEDSNTQTAAESIPQPASPLVIENVFTTLPLPLNELLSKTSLCKICNKHFISEHWLINHIQNDHIKTLPKTQQTVNLETKAFNENKTPSFIETCLMNADIKPIKHQQRYSLRERKSTTTSFNLDEMESDNDNDMEYTEENNCPSSNTNDSEDNVIKTVKVSTKLEPVKTVKRKKPKRVREKIQYTKCKICNKKIAKKHSDSHLKSWHDTTGLDDSQIIKCKAQSCSAYFLTQDQLNVHNRYEHNTIFRCHICQKTFSIKLLLSKHFRTDHGRLASFNPIKYLDEGKFKAKEFQCNFCKFVTISPTKLAIHESEHAVSIPYDKSSKKKLLRCPRCPYQYAKRSQRLYVKHHLRHHLSYLTGESLGACKMCSKGKRYVENTKTHFDRHHNTDLIEDPTQVFKCDECPAYYLKSFQLHSHKIRIHPIKTCDICERTFNSRRKLLGHMTVMHKDHQLNPALPMPCDRPNCAKRFRTETELEFHKIYTHKRNPEEKRGSVICEICGRGFNSTGLLKFHMSRTHVEKNWICSECGIRFKAKKGLETHMEYHKGPQSWKFECKECGKKCFDKYKLKSHMNTHTKEKPYICQFCGEKYAHRHNWKNHLKVKHMDKEGVDEIVNSKTNKRKGNYLSRKGTKKGDCVMAPGVK